jgi:hypothetical protein
MYMYVVPPQAAMRQLIACSLTKMLYRAAAAAAAAATKNTMHSNAVWETKRSCIDYCELLAPYYSMPYVHAPHTCSITQQSRHKDYRYANAEAHLASCYTAETLFGAVGVASYITQCTLQNTHKLSLLVVVQHLLLLYSSL